MASADRARRERPPPVIVGAEWFPDTVSGVNRYVRELFLALAAAGAPPVGVVVGPASDAPAGLVSVSPGPLPARVLRVARATAALRKQGDPIDAHIALYGLAALALARLTRRRFVAHFHGPWSRETVAAGRSPLVAAAQRLAERRVYRGAEAVVVLSEAFKRLLVEDYGVAAERVEVVPPAVELLRFRPGDRAESRRMFGLAESGAVAVTVRRLVPRMGIDDLLRAWARLDAPEATLVVAGHGPERYRLEALASQLGLGKRVRFFGLVPEERLADLYRAADVCVLPTRELEGFGLTALEALACGTPVVASSVGGLPETLAGLGADLLVPPGDEAALASRLGRGFDGSLPFPPAEACRRHAEAFSAERFATRHVELYARVLANPR